MRLDRFICKHTPHSHQTARRLVASGHVRVDGALQTDPRFSINAFSKIELGDQVLQQQEACFLMLNKPAGYLSATTDPVHPTVLELLPESMRNELHIAGRLDRATTGLMLLTNDGHWSRRITAPEHKTPKVYQVTTKEPISQEAEVRFEQGIWLARESVWTSPAQIERLSDTECRLTIYEGRHHQIKRMFAALSNEVCALHRESMGGIKLDPVLAPGEYRALTLLERSAY